MWELDYKESWALKNWCFWTVVLEKTLESPLDCKEMQPVHPKGNHPWIHTGRTDGETEAPVLWPSDAKNWLIGKDADPRKDWRQKEKGVTKDEMFGWHYRLCGRDFEHSPGDGEGQGSLTCCSPWGPQELDTPERLDSNSIQASKWKARSRLSVCGCQTAYDYFFRQSICSTPLRDWIQPGWWYSILSTLSPNLCDLYLSNHSGVPASNNFISQNASVHNNPA